MSLEKDFKETVTGSLEYAMHKGEAIKALQSTTGRFILFVEQESIFAEYAATDLLFAEQASDCLDDKIEGLESEEKATPVEIPEHIIVMCMNVLPDSTLQGNVTEAVIDRFLKDWTLAYFNPHSSIGLIREWLPEHNAMLKEELMKRYKLPSDVENTAAKKPRISDEIVSMFMSVLPFYRTPYGKIDAACVDRCLSAFSVFANSSTAMKPVDLKAHQDALRDRVLSDLKLK